MLIALWMLITTGCISKPRTDVILPPEPQREELPEAKTIEDLGLTINYYEHLVQSWEAWAISVKKIIGEKNPSQSGK